MDIAIVGLSEEAAQQCLTKAVIPRTIAWVSTVSGSMSAHHNLAPFSSLSVVCNKPPMIAFSCGRNSAGERKDTAVNILAMRQFVAHLVGASMLKQVVESSAELTPDVDEFELTGVESVSSAKVMPRRIKQALVALECELCRHLELGDEDARVDLFVGRIVHVAVADSVVSAWNAGEPADGCIPVSALWMDWYLTATGILRYPAM